MHQRKVAKTKNTELVFQMIWTVIFMTQLYFPESITLFQSKLYAKLMRAQESKQKPKYYKENKNNPNCKSTLLIKTAGA